MRKMLCVLLVVVPAITLAQVPATIGFTARLDDSGAPVSGDRTFTFRLFTAPTGGSSVWTETQTIPVSAGVVQAELGSVVPLGPEVFTGPRLYLEVTVGTTTLAPRSPVLSVPYAVRAAVASSVGTLQESDIQRRVTGSCSSGSTLTGIAADGTPLCQTLPPSAVTGVFAGPGLSGGGAGAVSLEVAFAGTGTASTVSRSDHSHSYLPVGAQLTCSSAQRVTGLDTGGNVICGPSVVSLTGSGPISVTGSGNLTVGLGGAVPVTSGGTGATSAAAARTALGAASSGANSDISSLSGLSTPLSTSQGGTGTTSLGSAVILNQRSAAQDGGLWVRDLIRTDGLLRIGSNPELDQELYQYDGPGQVSFGPYGQLVRQINLFNTVDGEIARSYGFRVNVSGADLVLTKTGQSPGTLSCQGFTDLNGQYTYFRRVPASDAVNSTYLLNIGRTVHLTCVLTSSYGSHHAEFTIQRSDDSLAGSWSGILTSTINQ